MPDPDLAALARDAERARRLPTTSRCACCGSDRHLLAVGGAAVCYADRRVADGAAAVELDHPAGRANLPRFVVPLHANDHRTVTEWRQRLGLDTWPAPDGDPLLLLAHTLAGLASLVLLIAEWLTAAAAHVTAVAPAAWEGARPAPIAP